EAAGLHGPGVADVGHPVGRDLQRDHHPALDPDRASGREVPPGRGRRPVAAELADLGRGRGDRALRGHQGDRPGVEGVRNGVKASRKLPMTKHIRANLLLFGLSIAICCVAYPLVLLTLGWTLFPGKSEGSLIRAKGPDGQERVVGSRQIAQPFTAPEYFWPRPSAATYNAAAAGASNWGANQPKLRDRAAQQLGGMIAYRSASASGQSGRTPQDDIVAWITAKPDRVADWAAEYSVATAGWARTDVTKDEKGDDKYGLQGDFI